jgi:transposase-like protein
MSLADVYALTPTKAYFALEEARWQGAPMCPYCQCSNKVWEHPEAHRRAPRLQCGACRRTFSVTVGTLFQKTQIPIRTWLIAIGMLAVEEDVTPTKLGKAIGIKRTATAAMMIERIAQDYISNPDSRQLIENLLKIFSLNPTNADRGFFDAI